MLECIAEKLIKALGSLTGSVESSVMHTYIFLLKALPYYQPMQKGRALLQNYLFGEKSKLCMLRTLCG